MYSLDQTHSILGAKPDYITVKDIGYSRSRGTAAAGGLCSVLLSDTDGGRNQAS